ncbi:SDR family oxidoreductase [Nocardioides sp. C4-1]|uniref:SDR family oxidoreductase n=1 Tax=Nocardioides sp. C4-1 TaxID=3151851 RepID=UPI00326679C7
MTTDPRTVHDQPDTEGEQLPDVGQPGSTTPGMGDEPDHGESSYVGHDRLTGKVALITGGDSGIGRAVAIAFAREGADVALVYLPEEAEDAEQTAAWVADAGRRVLRLPGDIRDRAFCAEAVGRTVDELGGLDVLVNNAAYQQAQPGGLADITPEQLDRVFKTNLYALFWLSQQALPHLSAGASIINTSSVQASSPAPPLLDYAVTKAGIVAFTRGLAEALGEQGVRVNSVAPGPIWTPLIPATMPEDQVAGFGETTPLGRAGQPAEVAPVFVFLAGDDSTYVTGEVVAVTGGKPVNV